jgi:hypothetical protein
MKTRPSLTSPSEAVVTNVEGVGELLWLLSVYGCGLLKAVMKKVLMN